MFKDTSSKKGVGLCLILLPFARYGRFCRNVCIDNTLWGCKRKKIANTLFEGDVGENISDINRAAPISHARKRTNLSNAVFMGISFNITATLTF